MRLRPHHLEMHKMKGKKFQMLQLWWGAHCKLQSLPLLREPYQTEKLKFQEARNPKQIATTTNERHTN